AQVDRQERQVERKYGEKVDDSHRAKHELKASPQTICVLALGSAGPHPEHILHGEAHDGDDLYYCKKRRPTRQRRKCLDNHRDRADDDQAQDKKLDGARWTVARILAVEELVDALLVHEVDLRVRLYVLQGILALSGVRGTPEGGAEEDW